MYMYVYIYRLSVEYISNESKLSQKISLQVLELGKDKHASNVVEKCFEAQSRRKPWEPPWIYPLMVKIC